MKIVCFKIYKKICDVKSEEGEHIHKKLEKGKFNELRFVIANFIDEATYHIKHRIK